MEFSGNPRDAISRLKVAVPLYKTLEHPNLISLIDHFETKDGYAAIFEWFNGECLHSHWLFAVQPKHSHPESPFYRFKQLSIEKRLQSLDTIYEFHKYVESKGYVAVDFYDGSILYDFSKWEANRSLYEVALRAVSKEREERFKTINDFINAWNSVKN